MKKMMVREEASECTVLWEALVLVEAFKCTVIWMALVLVVEVVALNLFQFTRSTETLALNLSRMWLPLICFDFALAIVGYLDFKKEIFEILEKLKNEKDDEMTK